MYTPTKLTEYLDKYGVSWAKTLPENTPPEDIVVAYNKEPLFRLIPVSYTHLTLPTILRV